jgi:hypothetical protein
MRYTRFLTTALLFAAASITAFAQASPPAETTATIGGKTITIKYSAPSVRGRKVFSEDGILKKDGTYPVWRAGANNATALETTGDIMIGSLHVPAGKYTIYVALENPWKLIINKQTGQWGTVYDAKQDLGRVPMTMSKPASMVEQYKMTLTSTGANAGKLTLEWENTSASVPIMVH